MDQNWSAIKSLRAKTCFSSGKIFCFHVYFTYKIIIAQLSYNLQDPNLKL